MKKIYGFISHRCKDYHNEWYKDVFEAFLFKNNILAIYGCALEPEIKGIISANIINGIERSQIYFAFISRSWSNLFNPIWPKKEWGLWQDIKKNTFFYDCCFGFYLQSNSHPIRRRAFNKLPSYISNLMTYSISDEKDEHHNAIFATYGKYKLYINKFEKVTVISKIKRYRITFMTPEEKGG